MIPSTPERPLLCSGEIKHRGWDIPTEWEQRPDGSFWRNFAHGGIPSIKTTARELIEMAQQEGDEATALRVAQAARMPRPEPVWAQQARAAGWTPPKGWQP